MKFFLACFLKYSFVILPLPRAVPGKVNIVVCDQNTTDQGILSETVRLFVILSNFLNMRVMGEESGNLASA